MINITELQTIASLDAIVKQVRKRRKQFKMTQGELASVLDVSQGYLSKIEKGMAPDVPFDLMRRIMDVFGLELMVGKIQSDEQLQEEERLREGIK